MIVNETSRDTKSLQNLRLSCKLLKGLSEKHFHEYYLTHLIVSPTSKALTRLSWTVQEPELAANIQSIVVTYDNTEPSASSAPYPGMWIVGEVDHLLRALSHLHHAGKQVDLIVKIAKTPVDGTCSIISIAYQVLAYVLFSYGARGVKKLFLDFDDTTSTSFPVFHTSQQVQTLHDDFGPRFQRIWARIMQIKPLSEVRIRFSKKNQKTDPGMERFLAIVRYDRGIHLGMQFLSTWHFDMLGRMSIFNNVFSLNILNCALITRHRDDLFKNPNLRDLILWNVCLYAVHRVVSPAFVTATAQPWDYTLRYIAANTTLQSLQIYYLGEPNGQYLYLDPWKLNHTQERSISQAILINHPS